MIVTGWKGGTYGLKVQPADRDQYFQKEWDHVLLFLEGHEQPVKVNIRKASFWNETCHELISTKIGDWFMENGLAPWPKGHPPRLVMEPMEENQFMIKASGGTSE